MSKSNGIVDDFTEFAEEAQVLIQIVQNGRSLISLVLLRPCLVLRSHGDLGRVLFTAGG